MKTNNKLWTRDFTIITLGSVVSMLGNAVSGFALGVMVLDLTNSTFLYALYMVVYFLPQLIMPLLAGPILDRIPRKIAIYSLDFLSAFLYLGMCILSATNELPYTLLLVLSALIGSIDSIYMVAYDSLYPNLVTEGNMSKAYSISSMLYPLASLMVPVASYCYENVGLAPLFAFDAATFLIAAIFETQIRAEEKHVREHAAEKPEGPRTFSTFLKDFREGMSYLRHEPGLIVITAYFFVSGLTGSAAGTLVLPYFKATENLGIMLYTIVMGASLIGRLVGGLLHYLKKIPEKFKFLIAVCVYLTTTLIEGLYLYLPVGLMVGVCFINGLICVTSYNIRISATQDYVPDDKRARFNGVFLVSSTLSTIIGELSAGVLGDVFPNNMRLIVTSFMGINLFAVIYMMIAGKKHVKPIYNRNI